MGTPGSVSGSSRFPDHVSQGGSAVETAGTVPSSSQRTWIDVAERHIEPDVNIETSRAHVGRRTASAAVTALAVVEAAEPVIVTVEHEEWVENYLEIFVGRGDQRRLVTSIEVLSPSNKTRHNKGRKLYRRKQRELLRRANVVEFDLLRYGLHTTAVPEDRLRRQTGQFDYHICTHRFDVPEECHVYPLRIEQPLPSIAVPLLSRDGHVTVDVQAVFNRAYDAGPYRRMIDYRHETPAPPLDDERMTWARARIAAALPNSTAANPPA